MSFKKGYTPWNKGIKMSDKGYPLWNKGRTPWNKGLTKQECPNLIKRIGKDHAMKQRKEIYYIEARKRTS
jgi:hypothetical protein